MRGVILKCIGGFYYVKSGELTGNEVVHECRAAGRFRNEDIKPLPGDIAEFSPAHGDELGYVMDIRERKNVLIRPAVANVDTLATVVSAKNPKCDYLLVDKLLINAKRANIDFILVINKCDVGDAHAVAKSFRHAGIRIIMTSAHTSEGISELTEALYGKITAFAGQSAVGKSSILNAIDPALDIKTGGLSKKTARGKHTTRTSELMCISSANAFVVDTPGFSVYGGEDIEPRELPLLYAEFAALTPCRYTGCLHDKEPGCIVKDAVEDGTVDGERYARYIQLLGDLRKRKETKYD